MCVADPQLGSNRQLTSGKGYLIPAPAPKSNGPSAGAEHEAVWVGWLRLPFQPTTSNSSALLSFAHCPNFRLQAGLIKRKVSEIGAPSAIFRVERSSALRRWWRIGTRKRYTRWRMRSDGRQRVRYRTVPHLPRTALQHLGTLVQGAGTAKVQQRHRGERG